MTAIKLGVDVKPVQDYLNRLSRATVTRIRRCVNIKSVALEKIREDNPEARTYGFKHLNRIIELQIKSYPRYVNNIERFLIEVKTIKEKIASLESLGKEFFGKILFKSNKHNLEFDIALTEEKFDIIKKKATIIYKLVEAQRKLLKPNMSGDEEANLRRLLSIELEKSEELIKELNTCMQLVFRALKGMKVFQVRFIKFLERCRANNFSNIIDDSQAFFDRLEKHISTFYAFKSYIQLFGIGLSLYAPYKEIQILGAVIFGGSFGLDSWFA